MSDETRTPDSISADRLAGVLNAMLKRANLSAREVAKRSTGISGNYVSALQRGRDSRGKPIRPNPDKLRALADGFARDPIDGTIDDKRAETVYRDLTTAAGYAVPAANPSSSGHARTVLYEFFRANPEMADTFEDLALYIEGGRLSERGERALIEIARAVKTIEDRRGGA